MKRLPDTVRASPVPAQRLGALSDQDWDELREAVRLMEYPSLAARLAGMMGTPIEGVSKLLPVVWSQRAQASAEEMVQRLFHLAVTRFPVTAPDAAHRTHRWLGASAGAVGGFFGLPGLLAELPVTTLVMLRAIGAVAVARGEDLNDLGTRLACCEVFALGGRSSADDGAETGYYSVRVALGLHLSVAGPELLKKGLTGGGSPAVVGLIRAIAARFGMVVSEKAAAQLVPVLGAAGGALLNTVFIDHFQDIAWGHFTVRRLERRYGRTTVEAAYAALVNDVARAA